MDIDVILFDSGVILLPSKLQSKKVLQDECVLGFPKKEIPRWNLACKMLMSVFKINTCRRETRKQEWAEWSHCDAGAKTGLADPTRSDGAGATLQCHSREGPASYSYINQPLTLSHRRKA